MVYVPKSKRKSTKYPLTENGLAKAYEDMQKVESVKQYGRKGIYLDVVESGLITQGLILYKEKIKDQEIKKAITKLLKRIKALDFK